jgi:tRNA A37 threonylcarbamoyladenosine modification protein TsaB
MCILVIDLSYQSGSVFILDESQEVLGEIESPESCNLPLQIQALTSQLEKKIQAVAIPKGPGNFTPLRLGATIAITLCTILNVPLITYSPFLNQIDENQSRGGALLDARSGLSYYAEFFQKGGKVHFTPTTLLEKNCETPYQTCKKRLGFHVINLFKNKQFTDPRELKIEYVKQPR